MDASEGQESRRPTAMVPRVAGVVLAAGRSSRMGRNKLVLQIAGEPMVRGVVRRAGLAGLDPVVVVLGYDPEATTAAIGELTFRAIVNPDPARGLTSSLRAGLEAVPEDAAAAVMILGDMPLVTVEMLSGLVSRYRSEQPAVVVSVYGDVAAPPTLFDARLFEEILDLPDTMRPRVVVRRYRAETAAMQWPADSRQDVDRPEDAERLGIEPDD